MSKNYAGLRNIADPVEADRIASRLLALRTRLQSLQDKRRSSNLMLATWNLRDFGAAKFGMGHRLKESLYYIAEMVSCFDLIAVQEVNRNLDELEDLMDILGRSEWDYIVTDATDGKSGNGERMAFLYSKDKVRFLKIAGEIVLPAGQLIVPGKKVMAPAVQKVEDQVEETEEAGYQFARTPFLVAFQAGWFHFNLCTVHIYYGDESGEKLNRRIAEIRRLVTYFANRQNNENKAVEEKAKAEAAAKAEKRAKAGLPPLPDLGLPGPHEYENYILLGDFNIVSPIHETMEALQSKGFHVPEEISEVKLPGAERHNFYDQIAIRAKDPRFGTQDGGTFDIYQDVFRDEDEPIYRDIVAKVRFDKDDLDEDEKVQTPLERYKKWRTWQISDHWPLWVQIKTDFTESYLEQFLQSK